MSTRSINYEAKKRREGEKLVCTNLKQTPTKCGVALCGV